MATDNLRADTATASPLRRSTAVAVWAVQVCSLPVVSIRSSTQYPVRSSREFPIAGAGLLGGLLVADAVDDFGDDFGGGDFDF